MRLTLTAARAPWRSRRDAITDGSVLAAALLLAWVLPLSWPSGEPTHAGWPGSLGFLLVIAVAVATRRWSWPGRLVAVAVGAGIAVLALSLAPGVTVTFDDPTNLWMPVAAAGASYGSQLYDQDRRRAWVMLLVLSGIVSRPWASSWTLVVISLLYVAAPMLFGMYLAARRALVTALVERAERAERERHLLAEAARTEERTRLAAEMHDIVTHRITLMVLHAGALRMTEQDQSCREIAERIRVTGSDALAELRDLIGVLRTPRPTGPATPARATEPAQPSADPGTPEEPR